MTEPWKLLVVDDDAQVRAITRMVIGGMEFEGRGVTILEADSAGAARALFAREPDIALLLVDVVMESEHAGLDLVRHVREDLGNGFVRIVLRTGNPGHAPERAVIRGYDINDYKEKTELTASKLETVVLTALRGYRDLRQIDAARAGLARVINAVNHLHRPPRRHEFAMTVLNQLTLLIGPTRGTLYGAMPAGGDDPLALGIEAATGRYAEHVGRTVADALPAPLLASLQTAHACDRHVFGADHYVLQFTDRRNSERLLVVGELPKLDALDRHLIEVFSGNVGFAYENLHLNQELFASQLEMICLLAGAAETRSRETANHVKRVGLIAEFLAREYGLDAAACEQLRYAAPLHDIGKISIPDDVLNKPGSHSTTEMSIMRTHAERGAELLSQSRLPLIRLAAEIAWTHHENWDGSGYPRGLAGEAIPISGRITALADVYDALGSKRCYKAAWERDAILTHLRLQRGRKFEPRLVDILINQWDVAEGMRRLLPD
jgi:putative nucleotidyltransferase with HDIG domain